MAVNWVRSFKSIPWTRVLDVAPSIADGAKKLWGRVAGKNKQTPAPPVPLEQKPPSLDPAVSAIETQVHALELRAAELGEELALSSQLIDKLADQQSQLVQAVDILRVRTRALAWVCALLALAVIVLTYFLTSR